MFCVCKDNIIFVLYKIYPTFYVYKFRQLCTCQMSLWIRVERDKSDGFSVVLCSSLLCPPLQKLLLYVFGATLLAFYQQYPNIGCLVVNYYSLTKFHINVSKKWLNCIQTGGMTRLYCWDLMFLHVLCSITTRISIDIGILDQFSGFNSLGMPHTHKVITFSLSRQNLELHLRSSLTYNSLSLSLSLAY